MTEPVDGSNDRDEAQAHRERIAERWRNGPPKGAHIRPPSDFDPENEGGFSYPTYPADLNQRLDKFQIDLLKAEEDREDKRERERKEQQPSKAKKIFDWTFTPAFFLAAGSSVVAVVIWLVRLQLGQQTEIHDLQIENKEILLQIQNVQESVKLNRTDFYTAIDRNKSETDLRAAKYIGVIENLTKNQETLDSKNTLQDTRFQNMVDSVADFRKVMQESLLDIAHTVKDLAVAQSRTETTVAVMQNQMQQSQRGYGGPAPRGN